MSGRGDARKRSAAAPGPLKLTCLELLHCNVGPSDAARAKGILKRQRMAGTVLSGRAAKLKRRADLVSRGVDDEEVLDELTAAIGLPGQVFYVNGSKGKKLPQLPDNMQVRVSLGEHDACAANRAYHAFVCLGKPDTAAGRDHALAHGWAAPQQAFALQGRHPGSVRQCNISIGIHCLGEPVCMLAMSLDSSARACMVQAIHVVPKQRGPMQLPAHLWAKALESVVETARGKGSRSVRFSLEMACCQSQQGAHFWICRMGWDGTEHARQAAREWGQGVKWKPGTYELWHVVQTGMPAGRALPC